MKDAEPYLPPEPDRPQEPVTTQHEVGAGRQPSQSARLLAMTDEAGDELFHTQSGETYARVRVRDHLEVHRLGRQGSYRRHLARRFYSLHRQVPSVQAMGDALAVLEAHALHEGDEHDVYLRLAPHPTEPGFVLDLADEEWRQVVVTAERWHITLEPLVRFRRPPTMRALPTPKPGGNLDRLRHLLLIPDDVWVLLLVWLLGALHPSGPYALLLLVARHGSGKSLLARMLKAIIDPTDAPLRAAPRHERDLLIAARNTWAIVYDNLSTVSPDLSDALCRLATGGGLSTRQLFTNDDETVLEAKRPVIITGIEDVVTRGDLLDRALPVELPPIDAHSRRTEGELLEAFATEHPFLLGALLDAAVVGFQRLPALKPATLPRLADAALWAMACEPATGLPEGTIATALQEITQQGAYIALDADPLAAAVQALIEQHGPWRGRATALLHALEEVAPENARRARTWPKVANAAAGRLRRLAPSLQIIGIVVTSTRSRGFTTWRIDRAPEPAAERSLPSPPEG